MSVPSEAWRADANCKDRPVDMFFPDPKDRVNEQRAKAVCALCTVRVECLKAGEGLAGIWGGYNAAERARWAGNLDENGHLRDLPVSRWTYKNQGCRCKGCAAEARAYNAEFWQRKKAKRGLNA